MLDLYILISIFIELACLYLFCNISSRNLERINVRLTVWFVFSLSLRYLVEMIPVKYLYIRELCILSIYIIIMFQIKQNSIYKVMIFSAIYMLLMSVSEIITVIIVDSVPIKSNEDNPLRKIISLLIKISILLMITIAINYFRIRNTGDRIYARNNLLLILFPIITLCILIYVFINWDEMNLEGANQHIWGILYSLVLFDVLFVFFCIAQNERNRYRLEKKIFITEAKNQQNMYRSLEDKIEIQRKLSHDYRNHLTYIASLLKQGEYEKADNYLKKIQISVSQDLDIIDTNNPIINTVINCKYHEAKNKNIVVSCKVNDLSDIVIDEVDIIVLLSNLFNNAIEACEKLEHKKMILFKIIKEEKMLIISIQNTCADDVLKDGDRYVTTKKDNPHLHGIGISNIVYIVEKYKGIYRFEKEDNLFKVVISIPN